MSALDLVLAIGGLALGMVLMAVLDRRHYRTVVLDHCRRGFAYLSMRQEHARFVRGVDIGVAFDPEHAGERDRRLREGNWIV